MKAADLLNCKRLLCSLALAASLLLTSGASFGAPWGTSQADGIPWSHATAAEVIVVGDIHGDLSALVAILTRRGLVDSAGHWVGGKKHLVLMGDYVDRGADTRDILDWVIRLETEAVSAGGKVHPLLGNHELMILSGDVRYATTKEHKAFKEFASLDPTRLVAEEFGISRNKAAIIHALRKEQPYAEWLRTRNSIIRINRTLFVHAGIDEWLLSVDPERINATIRQWIRHYQSGSRKPGSSSGWVIDDAGPLWNRRLAELLLERTTVNAALAKYNADQLVIAHTPTESGKVERIYGGRIIMSDTGISEYYGGGLSSLIIRDGKARAAPLIERPTEEPALVEILRNRRASLCSRLAERYAPD